MKSPVLCFIINSGLLLFGSIMAFSGLLIQLCYHMGHQKTIDIYNTALRINYSGWSYIHKISIIFFSVFIIFHIPLHWKWYKFIVKKKFITINNQLVILSVVFIFVAVTGYIPLIIKLTGGNDRIHKAFIEVHDKLALILFVYLIFHVAQRFRWFIITFEKLKK